MPTTIEESVRIAASPEAIWKLLESPWGWPQWWSACRDARTEDRKPLRDGSRLVVVLRPGWLTMTFRPVVDVCQPDRALIWTGTGAGVTGRHSFFLELVPGGTRVRQREELSGPGLGLMFLLGQIHATRRMFRDNLKGLKRQAERGG